MDPRKRPEPEAVDELTLALALANRGVLLLVAATTRDWTRCFHMCSHHTPLFRWVSDTKPWPFSDTWKVVSVRTVSDAQRKEKCVFCARRYSRLEKIMGGRGRAAVRRYLSSDPRWGDACSP